MADEITIQLSLEVVSGNFRTSFRPSQVQIDLASTKADQGVQTISTSAWTLIAVANAAAGGISWFRNISTSATTSQYIKLASGATNSEATNFPFANLAPGEHASFRNVTTVVSAKAVSTNSNALQYGFLSP